MNAPITEAALRNAAERAVARGHAIGAVLFGSRARQRRRAQRLGGTVPLRCCVQHLRYGLIADVLHVPLGSREIRRALNEKAQRTYVIPGARHTRVAVETMRDWLSLYRTGGFEALYPKPRSDRGLPRRLPPEVAEGLLSLKTEQPALSVSALIKATRERGVDHPLAPSTVHRLLSREGLLDKRSGEPVATDRRRFALRDAGELWMSDVMHGPKVRDARRRRKTFLLAFIDDAH